MSNEELQGRNSGARGNRHDGAGRATRQRSTRSRLPESNEFLSHMGEAIDAQAASLPLEAWKPRNMRPTMVTLS